MSQKSDNSVLYKASTQVVANIDAEIALLDKAAKLKINRQRFAAQATAMENRLADFQKTTHTYYSRYVRSEGMPAPIVTMLKHLQSAANQAKSLTKIATAKVVNVERVETQLAAVRKQLHEARELLMQEYIRDDTDNRAALQQREQQVAQEDKNKFSDLHRKYSKYEKKLAVPGKAMFTIRQVPIAIRFESHLITPSSLKKLGFKVEALSVNVSDKKQQLGLILEDQYVVLINQLHATANVSRAGVSDYANYTEAAKGEAASLRSLRKQLQQVQEQRDAAKTPMRVRDLDRKIEQIEKSIAMHEESAKNYAVKRAAAKRVAPKLTPADALFKFADRALEMIEQQTGHKLVIANKAHTKSPLNPEYVAFWILDPHQAKMLENLTNGKTAARWSFAWT